MVRPHLPASARYVKSLMALRRCSFQLALPLPRDGGASLYTASRAQLHGLLDGGGVGAPQAGAWAAIAVLVSYASDVVSP